MPLVADRTYTANGLKVHEYLLTKHNLNNIAMPTNKMPNVPLGITIHNTENISVASNTTPAEQYTRATIWGNMNDVRVHFYVDAQCAWQNLPFDLCGWHAADGGGNGNRKTIAIEVIGNSKEAEANAVKLTAYLLNKWNLNADKNLFTHTYWLNVKDGKTGTIDYLNTLPNPYKCCPAYILPHWQTFKSNVAAALNKLQNTENNNINNTINITQTTVGELYRIRKDWSDINSQIGAFTSLDKAKENLKSGYNIYDSKGNIIIKNDEAAAEQIDVYYRVYTKKRWLGEIKNCEDQTENGYAGIENYPISCLAMKLSKGLISYRAHLVGGGWLNWINQYNLNDLHNGYAGLPNSKIDAVQIKLNDLDNYEVQYRVSSIKSNNYYDWVLGIEDYAGIFGKPIDKIQIKIVKK